MEAGTEILELNSKDEYHKTMKVAECNEREEVLRCRHLILFAGAEERCSWQAS